MCAITFDLLPSILNNGTVNCKMGSQVVFMPVAIKFGLSLLGDTVRAILSHAAVTGHTCKKLVKGQLWVEVTHVTIHGHMNVLPSMS